MDLNILNKTYDIAEAPGLDTFDPRLGDIASLVENGDYIGAAVQSEQIIGENVYDFRIIAYFLYGAFLEQGVSALPSVFQILALIFAENYDAVGPVKNKPKQTANSLKWFTGQLIKALEYEEGKKGPAWELWIGSVSSDDMGTALEAYEKFQRALSMKLEDAAGPILEILMKVKAWMSAFQKLVYIEPEPEPEPEASEAAPEAGEADARPTARPGLSFGGDIAAEGSFRLQELLNKLSAFEHLVRSKKFSLAALVAEDINSIVSNFDPKLYFPKMFAKFSFLYALHIADIISFDPYKGSVEWNALKELYKVDLENFVAFDGNIQFSAGTAGAADMGGMNGMNAPGADQSQQAEAGYSQSADDDY